MSRHLDSSSRNRGFTLIEALVAMTLLTTALVPAYILASNATSLSARIRNELIAAGLAQEGVEIVRAIRDANWFKEPPEFSTNLEDCDTGCAFQYDSPEPESIDPDATPLRVDPDTGLYQYGDGPVSPFTRVITVTAPNEDELIVESLVRWSERDRTKEMLVRYHLFNWIQ